MDQQRPALSQSPLRMHNNKNSGSSNNFSQKQLGALPNQGNNRASDFKASPIRESLIKNTGAFILGNGNQGNSQGASGGTGLQPITQQPSNKQLLSNFNTTNAAAGNSDLPMLATNPYARDRSADRAEFDFGDRNHTKDMSPPHNGNSRGDVLDNFMSLPKQQQMQIQMLTEQQQMAYITQHRAETSGVKLHNNHKHFNQLNSATFRGVPPSSGGTGAAAIAYNPLHQHQQQSSQPILHTTSKYGVGPSQPVLQARQSQVPQFSGINSGSGTNGDSGSFTLQRNMVGGLGLTNQQDSNGAKKNNLTISNSPQKGANGIDTIKNKRVFIENTGHSILHNKDAKTSSLFMNKPVGVMSGTGTTDIHPKVHSVSPRGNVGSSIVGLPNIVVGGGQAPGATTNVSKVNRSGGVSPTKEGGQGGGQGLTSMQPQRALDVNRQVDDFLAETDKMTFI